MPHLFPVLFILLFTWSLASGELTPGGAQYREFKSAQGSILRARILSYDKDAFQVRLRTSDQRDISVDLKSLSKEDQLFVTNWDAMERVRGLFSNLDFQATLEAFGMKGAPFIIRDKNFLLPVSLNGSPSEFLVDTGTFLSIVDRKVATAANAKFTGTVYAEFDLADGTKEIVESALFRTFRVGPIETSRWQMGTCDLSKTGRPFSGVIGGDFIELKRGILDWGEMKMFFSAGKSPRLNMRQPSAQLREFTSRNGGKITGRPVKYIDGRITIHTNSGKPVTVKSSDLVNRDREYLDLWRSSPMRSQSEIAVAQALGMIGLRAARYSYGNSTVAAFELKKGTKTLRFLINPSYQFSFFDKEKAIALDIPIESSKDHLRLGDGTVLPLETGLIGGIEVEDLTLPPLNFRMIDLEAANANNAIPISTCMMLRFPELKERLTKQPLIHGILGRDLLNQLGIVIDYDSQRLFVSPSRLN